MILCAVTARQAGAEVDGPAAIAVATCRVRAFDHADGVPPAAHRGLLLGVQPWPTGLDHGGIDDLTSQLSHMAVHRGSESAKVLLRERVLLKQRSSPVLTECSATLFEFAPVEGRQVVAAFDGGAITSDAGALLLGETDRAIQLTGRFAACFTDARGSGRARG